MKTYAIVGNGTPPAKAVKAALEDLPLGKDDAFQLAWADGRKNPTMGTIFDFILGDEADESTQFQFVLSYKDGEQPEAWFRDAPKGIVQKTRDPQAKSLDGADVVLFLWDDEQDESQIDFVFDAFSEPVEILNLSNGLVPIVASPEDLPEPIEADEYIEARERIEEELDDDKEIEEAISEFIESATRHRRSLKLVASNGEEVDREAKGDYIPVAEEPATLAGLIHGLADTFHDLFDQLEEIAQFIEKEK